MGKITVCMARTRLITVEQAKAGQRLALDVKVGKDTFLTAFSELTEEHISHLRDHGVGEIVIVDETAGTEVTEPTDDYEILEPLANVPDAKLSDAIAALDKECAGELLPEVSARLRPAQTLHLHAYAYARALEPDRSLPVETPTEEEEWFSRHKEQLRSDAGLVPVMSPVLASEVSKRLKHAQARISAGETVSNETLGELAQFVLNGLNLDSNSYVSLEDLGDAADLIPAHTVRTVIVFLKVAAPDGEKRKRQGEFIKGIACYNLGLASVVSQLARAGEIAESALEKLPDEYKNLYHKLRRAEGVEESVLEMVFLQNEHADGEGFPYGLSYDSIPQHSQLLALASKFALLTLSKPRLPRLAPRSAAIRILARVSNNFYSSTTGLFLKELGIYPVGSAVKLADERLALVTRLHPEDLLNPVVRIIRSDSRDAAVVGQPLDLRRNDLSIAGALREF